MKKTFPILLILFFSQIFLVQAQTGGSWIPARADTTFPRSIIHSWEVPDVKASLATGQNLNLYSNLYDVALSTVPSGNSSLSDRYTRAAIAKDAAFVYLLGIKPNGNTVANLTPTERTNLKTKAIQLLEQTNTYIYPITPDSPMNWDFWQYISKHIMMELEAYDFLRGGGVTTNEIDSSKRVLKAYVGNLYLQGSLGVAGANFFQTAKNNHALMTLGAIGLGAVLLGDMTDSLERYQPNNWINCAMWNIHNVMWWDVRKLSDPKKNAGYSEGTYYCRYAFANLLPFFRAIGYYMPDTTVFYSFQGINRKLRNPWYDTNYVRIYDWLANVRFPDGRMPPIEDSYTYKHFPELSILRKQQYLWPMHLSNLDSTQDNSFDKQVSGVYDMRADYISANLTPQERNDSLFKAYPDAGIAVFRSGNDSAANYMAILGKNGSALASSESHNHADDASFLMMVNGQMMAMDPGYGQYELRISVANAENHNMILVNGKATDFGFPGKSNGSQTYIEKYFQSPVQNYAEVRTNYQNTNINRKFMHVRNKYFLVVDHVAMTDTVPKIYTMLLHGYGTNDLDSIYNGKFTNMFANKRAAWQRRQSGIYAYFNSDQTINFASKIGIHEHTYQVLQPHIYTNTSNVSPSSEMMFMTLIQPFKSLKNDTFPVTTLDVSGALGYKVTEGTNIDLAVAKSFDNAIDINKTTTGLSNNYNTNARFFWAQESAGLVNDFFVQKATYATRDNDTLFTSDAPVNLQYLANGANSFKGYIGEAGYVNFFTKGFAHQVLGTGVYTTSYDTLRKVNRVYFGKPCTFILNIDDARLGLHDLGEAFKMSVYPNPAGDQVTVEFGEFTNGGSKIEVMDITGKVVIGDLMPDRTAIHQLNTSHLETGVYFVTLNDPFGNRSRAVKLMINK